MAKGRGVSTERITDITTSIVKAFREGTIPTALAQIFIHPKIEVPSQEWSFTNRLIGIARGHVYAAGIKQWAELERTVKKGERAFFILAPRYVRIDEDRNGEKLLEEERVLVGFRPIPVFGYLQTKGRPLPGAEAEAEFVDGLPLIDLARAWGLTVETFSIRDDPSRAGIAVLGSGIGLSVRNLHTWAHELIHQAEHRLGVLLDDKYAAEVVATLGASTLLEALGFDEESDRGQAYAYLKQHPKGKERNMLGLCSRLIERTARAVSHILEEADRLPEHARGLSWMRPRFTEELRRKKIETLVDQIGLESLALLEHYQSDGLVPSICMRPECDYWTELEPDQTAGWCESCQTRTLTSLFILAEIL